MQAPHVVCKKPRLRRNLVPDRPGHNSGIGGPATLKNTRTLKLQTTPPMLCKAFATIAASMAASGQGLSSCGLTVRVESPVMPTVGFCVTATVVSTSLLSRQPVAPAVAFTVTLVAEPAV